MELTVKVNRTHYMKLRQSDLGTFADNVVTNTFGVAAYSAVQDEADDVKAKSNAYQLLLSQSVTGGHPVKMEKDLAKQALIESLNTLATAIEMNAAGNPMYILNAGFSLHKSREVHTETVEPPYDLLAKSNGMPNEALLRMKVHKRYELIAVAVEWSPDGENNWTNGTYHKGTLITVKGLPPKQTVYFRVRILATRDRKSAWTEEVVSAFIL